MFKRTKKTEIISTPVEEVLEVEEVPTIQELVAIDFVKVKGNFKYIYFGTAIDYDGVEYEFQWDDSKKELCRLAGTNVTEFLWNSAYKVLEKRFKKPEVEQKLDLESFYQGFLSAMERVEKKIEHLEQKKSVTITQVESRVPVATPEQVVKNPHKVVRVPLEAVEWSEDTTDSLEEDFVEGEEFDRIMAENAKRFAEEIA